MELLPLLFLFFAQQKLFGWVIRFIVSRQLGFHWCNVNNTSLFDGSTGPCVIKLLLLFFFFLIVLVPLDSTTQESIENFIDFHLFPFGRHEVAFAGWMGVEGHWVIIFEFIRVVFGGDGFGGHFSASDSVDDLKLLVCELDVFHVELISDGSPPVFVFRFLDKFFNFITSFFLGNFFKLVVISEMLEFVIPSIRNFTNLDLDLLVLFIVGFVVTDFNIFLLWSESISWTYTF